MLRGLFQGGWPTYGSWRVFCSAAEQVLATEPAGPRDDCQGIQMLHNAFGRRALGSGVAAVCWGVLGLCEVGQASAL